MKWYTCIFVGPTANVGIAELLESWVRASALVVAGNVLHFCISEKKSGQLIAKEFTIFTSGVNPPPYFLAMLICEKEHVSNNLQHIFYY